MDWHEISGNLEQLWENKPRAVVLLIVGLVIFVLLVVDTWRHRQRHKHRIKHWRHDQH